MSSSSSIPNLSGRTIDNRYELLSRLGSGSWGIVYKALDLTMSPDDESRFCAIKVVHLKGHKTPITSSLKREMVFHGRVASHPNVVTLRDSFINKEHAVFVMDMSSGGDLEEYIAKKGECTDEAELRSIFSQVLDAVVKLHEEKIYHRDLKPANILLEGDSFTPLLADFGLAVDEPRYRSRCGTQAYMPPGMRRLTFPCRMLLTSTSFLQSACASTTLWYPTLPPALPATSGPWGSSS